MGLLPNPWVLLALIAASAGVSAFAYLRGYDAAQQTMQIEVARLNEQARLAEQQMSAQSTRIATTLKKANDEAHAEIERLRADVVDGTRRLSIATRQVHPAGDPAAACRGGDEARAELDPEAAQTLVTIAVDGDAAIRQLNACIDAYEAVRGSTQ